MNSYIIIVALPTLVQFFMFARWLYRRMRDDEINRAFVKDMAVNHLPHLYHGMKQLAKAQGLELEEPPPVKWIELNGKARR